MCFSSSNRCFFSFSLLDGLLYQFDKDTSQLTNKRFEFNLYPEHSKNQKHYEALGEVNSNDQIFS